MVLYTKVKKQAVNVVSKINPKLETLHPQKEPPTYRLLEDKKITWCVDTNCIENHKRGGNLSE